MTDEVALLIAAAAPQVSASRIAEFVSGRIDWDAFLTLARRHRVQGLVHRGFTVAKPELPPSTATALRDDASLIAQRNLLHAAETASLCRALSARQVPVVVLKGVALGILAHGSLAPKMSWDIDLLVPAAQLDTAAEVVIALGYDRIGSSKPLLPVAEWHRFAKDSAWRRPATGTHLELHTDLTENPAFLLPGVAATNPVQLVTISPGVTVPTLGDDELFAYLTVHGAISGWRRLKWLADFAGLIARSAEADLTRQFAAAQRFGAERAAAQALLLSARFFGTPLPATVVAAARADWKIRALVGWAARIMTNPKGYDGADDTALGTVPLHIMLTFLVPGLPYKQAELRRRLRPDPRTAGPLPYTLRRLAQRLSGAKPH